jgi:hypothetical protein
VKNNNFFIVFSAKELEVSNWVFIINSIWNYIPPKANNGKAASSSSFWNIINDFGKI